MVAEGVFKSRTEEEVTAGVLDIDEARAGASEELKCVPGPVSSLGSGAVKGSRRYLAACG